MTIQVTELPIGMWTVNFKEHLESLMEGGSKDKKSKKDTKPIIKMYKDDWLTQKFEFKTYPKKF